SRLPARARMRRGSSARPCLPLDHPPSLGLPAALLPPFPPAVLLSASPHPLAPPLPPPSGRPSVYLPHHPFTPRPSRRCLCLSRPSACLPVCPPACIPAPTA